MTRFEWIDRHREVYPVVAMCSALSTKPSGYYKWRLRRSSAQAGDDRLLRCEIRALFKQFQGRYGSPRIHRELVKLGYRCGRHQAARIMREEGLSARPLRRRRPRFRVVGDAPAPNRLDRQFDVESPDTVWAGDLTYLWTPGGWIYLAVVMDLFSRRIVGWWLDSSPNSELVQRALEVALQLRQPSPGLMIHHDQGCQYTARDYLSMVDQHGMVLSMSRKSTPWDNAVVESFFATFKKELGGAFTSIGAARTAVFQYIEIDYNRQRSHSTLDYLSPAEYERYAESQAA